jgi:hypothetical protein
MHAYWPDAIIHVRTTTKTTNVQHIRIEIFWQLLHLFQFLLSRWPLASAPRHQEQLM